MALVTPGMGSPAGLPRPLSGGQYVLGFKERAGLSAEGMMDKVSGLIKRYYVVENLHFFRISKVT